MIQTLLWRIADNGRIALVTGLLTGLAFPALAASLQPWLPQMVAVLLVVTALRIGHRAAGGALSDLRWGIGSVVILQLLLPVTLFGLCWSVGLGQSPVTTALVLATSAPAISGAPNLALMLGQDAGRMMQILVLGTALFPVTALPLMFILPHIGGSDGFATPALVLLCVIVIAVCIGFALRVLFFPKPSSGQLKALEGLSVFAFSAIVVGLMAAVSPALRQDPGSVALWALLAFAISYGVQTATYLTLRQTSLCGVAGPLAIGAGNRNIALFLVALPDQVLAPLMVFIGCWQLPMYLTPILLRRLYMMDT